MQEEILMRSWSMKLSMMWVICYVSMSHWGGSRGWSPIIISRLYKYSIAPHFWRPCIAVCNPRILFLRIVPLHYRNTCIIMNPNFEEHNNFRNLRVSQSVKTLASKIWPFCIHWKRLATLAIIHCMLYTHNSVVLCHVHKMDPWFM